VGAAVGAEVVGAGAGDVGVWVGAEVVGAGVVVAWVGSEVGAADVVGVWVGAEVVVVGADVVFDVWVIGPSVVMVVVIPDASGSPLPVVANTMANHHRIGFSLVVVVAGIFFLLCDICRSVPRCFIIIIIIWQRQINGLLYIPRRILRRGYSS
jgi:hypothetical protein